jgi:hypothetical protein
MKQIALPASDDRLLWDIWMSAFHFPALALADEVGLFASLERGPASAPEVATSLSLSLGSAEALLGVMTSLGLLEQQAGRFALTESARVFLLEDSPYSWRAALRVFRHIPATFGAMQEALQKPAPASIESGDAPGDWASPAAFTRAMHSLSFGAAMVLAERIDFRGVRRLLDVGGGSGSYCIALAMRHPDIRFTVMDIPEVCPTTRDFVREYGLEDRIAATPGDMYAEAWPSGYDVHFLANIFHDMDAPGCLHLAQRSYQALLPGGRLCVHEILQNDTKDGPPAAAGFSLAMRYFNGRGGQYTAAEIAAILGQAGFIDIQTAPTAGYYSMVTGWKH